MGSLANADEKYFKHKNPYWIQNLDHTTYDEVWQSRSIWKYLKGIKPAVMVVGLVRRRGFAGASADV